MHQTYREVAWNEAGFARFYQEYASPLLDYLRTRTRTLEDAEDILVEVFLAARQNEKIAREIPRGQLAWLRQVARNKLVDCYRRRGQAYELSLEQAHSLLDPADTLDPEMVLLRAESVEQLQAAIKCLPETQQELLRLRFAEGLRCPQIATRMGKRAGSIRTMLVRTLKTLREIYHAGQEGHR
jgi:RNA polymerase sigma factor (sigma-70 family)